MKYIVLKGASNVGKTTTLGYLNKMIKCEPYYNENNGNDFVVIYKNYKGLNIVITSAGDYDEEISENMEMIFGKCKNVDIIFCASRLYRKGKDYFKKVKDEKIEIQQGYIYGNDEKMIEDYHKYIAEFLYMIAFNKK